MTLLEGRKRGYVTHTKELESIERSSVRQRREISNGSSFKIQRTMKQSKEQNPKKQGHKAGNQSTRQKEK